MPQDDLTAKTSRAFTYALDREGYSFHQAILRHVERLAQEPAGRGLAFEVSEFPVVYRGEDARIDFVLRLRSQFHDPDVLLICECKRSNPALRGWCFARTPYVRLHRTQKFVIAEQLLWDISSGRAQAFTVRYAPERAPYEIGLPVNIGEEGPQQGGGTRDLIEKAAGQVMGGLNGFADFLSRNEQLLRGERVFLIPVIFTTASLYGSDVDLGGATLATGKLSADANVEPIRWLWLQYHVSSSIRHRVQRPIDPSVSLASLGNILDQEHLRSIAVVSVNGIEEFIIQAAANAARLFQPIR